MTRVSRATCRPRGRRTRSRAAEALHEAFTRLAPQGSDAWNFLAAFTHLGDRYGPYHPGASALSDSLSAGRGDGRRSGPLDRLRPRRDRAGRAPDGEKTDLEEAMGHVVEAFRFLSARVETLEARLAAQDRPVDGAAWLVPARAIGALAGPVAAHMAARTPGGVIVHADCGEGDLLRALHERGAEAHGVEPRGAVALRAIEQGCTVTIAEASEDVASRPDGSVGGIVLSGVVDRLPLHALLPLLAQSRRVLRRGAPLVVVSEPVAAVEGRDAAARDLVDGVPLHESTWVLLLERAGFVEVGAAAGRDRAGPAHRPVRRRPFVSGIHHFVPVLHRGDAVGRHTLRLREATRARGVPSEIFVDTVDDDTAAETMPVLSYPETAQPGDVVVYQFATASAMAPWLAGRSETLVVNYHNVTPPELMAPWDNHLALGQLRAQGDLRLLAPRTALAVADSRYNEAHLAASGFTTTAVISPSAALQAAGAATAAAQATVPPRGARWLAIGRVSPNKGLESTIAALAVARAHGDPAATLLLIGKPATDSYDAALHRYAAELGLAGAVQFAGHAGDATVASAYAGADVLVVTSEHEGFCVPVVEAMAAGLPVVAFDQGAVPEVLGGAGVLVSDKDPYALAAAIAALLRDAPRRNAVVEAGRRRLAALDLDSAADRFVNLLVPLAGPSHAAP